MRAILLILVALVAACVPWTADSCRPVIGQTTKAEMVQMCGRPTDVRRTQLEGLIHEQWRYGGYPYTMLPVSYYYFENGVLTAIQD